jgi:hypothetical protein
MLVRTVPEFPFHRLPISDEIFDQLRRVGTDARAVGAVLDAALLRSIQRTERSP